MPCLDVEKTDGGIYTGTGAKAPGAQTSNRCARRALCMREHHANQGRPDDRTSDDLGNRIDPVWGRSRAIPHLMSGHRDGISPMEIGDEDLRALSIDQFFVLPRTASSCKPRLNSPVPEGTAATPVRGPGPMPDRDRGDDGVPAESPAAWRHALGPPDGARGGCSERRMGAAL
jgi:hypothetical protein